eukprot:1289252-Pyramimonas_sp.AAC.1
MHASARGWSLLSLGQQCPRSCLLCPVLLSCRRHRPTLCDADLLCSPFSSDHIGVLLLHSPHLRPFLTSSSAGGGE